MTVVSTLDLTGLTANEYRAAMDELAVEATVVSTLDLTTVTRLHNFFAPRPNELPAPVPSLPGAPSAIPADAR